MKKSIMVYMSRIEIKIHINTSPEKVIDFVADPDNMIKFFPTLKENRDVERVSGVVGTTWSWTFVNLGEEISGTSEIVEYVKGERFSFLVKGGISGYEGRYTFSTKKENDGCELSLIVNYLIPESIRGKILSRGRIVEVDETDIDRINEAETNIMLRILKSLLESK